MQSEALGNSLFVTQLSIHLPGGQMHKSVTEVWHVLVFTWIALVWILGSIAVGIGSSQYVQSLDQVLTDSNKRAYF